MPTQNVNLHEHHSNFIRQMTDGGRYKNASEVVRAGLRLLENQEEEQRLKLERLRAEVQKGIDSIEAGDYIEINNREELTAFFDDIEKEAEGILDKKAEHESTSSSQ